MARVIVLGLGGMGSAAAYHCQARGHQVIGLELNERLHKRGASHGQSRIIRQAYYEAPDYVPLLMRAYELWKKLEQDSGQQLLSTTGGIYIASPDDELITGSHVSCNTHGLPYEMLSPRDVELRFPNFRMQEDQVAFYEANAGLLRPESCINAHLDLAEKLGAKLQFQEGVTSFSATMDGVSVSTDQRTYEADRLIITAGPWAAKVLTELNLPLVVHRIVNAHFSPDQPERFRADRCPVFIISEKAGFYYGCPILDEQGLKIGRHDDGQICTPETIDRQVYPEEVENLRRLANKYMPGAGGAVVSTLTCMYTRTPDTHFIIDKHALHNQIVYGCGFSGHGFKFASVMGEILADLAIESRTAHPVGFLSRARFGQVAAP